MPTPSNPHSPHSRVAALSRLENVEQQRRALAAEQLGIIGELVFETTKIRPCGPRTYSAESRSSSGEHGSSSEIDQPSSEERRSLSREHQPSPTDSQPSSADGQPSPTDSQPSSAETRTTLAPDELAYRSLRAELALLLSMSEYQAERLMDLAYRAVYEYQKLLPTIASGIITQQHAQVICDAGLLIGASNGPSVMERRAGYEAAVLEIAAVETPNRLLPLARRLAETWAETPIEIRHERARSERRVTVTDAEDGMADLIAHLPAPEAYAIRDRLTKIAKSAKQGHRVVPLPATSQDSSAFDASTPDASSPDASSPDVSSPDASSPDVSAPETSVYNPETSVKDADAGDHTPDSRTRDQFRADALVDLLLSSDPFALTSGSPTEAIDARIQLISPAGFVEAESGTAGLSGDLAGYGPIDETTFRRFAAQSSHLERITTHRDTGEVISVDRYRPSEQIRRIIGARDRHCRFPGCRVPIQRCDLDHTIDAAFGGETSTDNLGALCRGHHTLKHHSEWSVEQHPGGIFEWTSPTGRVHLDRPSGSYRWPARRSGQSTRRDPDEPPRRSSRVRFEAI